MLPTTPVRCAMLFDRLLLCSPDGALFGPLTSDGDEEDEDEDRDLAVETEARQRMHTTLVVSLLHGCRGAPALHAGRALEWLAQAWRDPRRRVLVWLSSECTGWVVLRVGGRGYIPIYMGVCIWKITDGSLSPVPRRALRAAVAASIRAAPVCDAAAVALLPGFLDGLCFGGDTIGAPECLAPTLDRLWRAAPSAWQPGCRHRSARALGLPPSDLPKHA